MLQVALRLSCNFFSRNVCLTEEFAVNLLVIFVKALRNGFFFVLKIVCPTISTVSHDVSPPLVVSVKLFLRFRVHANVGQYLR